MSHIYFSIVTFVCLYQTVFSVNYWVSHNSSDLINCGTNPLTACGTMYFVSNQINLNDRTVNIYINGQNQTQIEQYLESHGDSDEYYNPCLLKPLYPLNTYQLNVHFDPNYIKNMNDWYPDICDRFEYSNNTFAFQMEDTSESFNTITIRIYNMIFNNYRFQKNGILKTNAYRIYLNNCTFENIISLNIHVLIQTDTIEFNQCSFDNITIENAASFIQSTTIQSNECVFDNIIINGSVSFIRSDHGSLYFTNNVMQHIVSDSSFILSVKARIVRFINVYLDDIATESAFFKDDDTLYASRRSTISIENCQFLNINNGAIFKIMSWPQINVINTTISTKQVMLEQNAWHQNILFDLRIFGPGFAANDVYWVNFENVQIHYGYYLHANCQIDDMYDYMVNNHSSKIISLICLNPKTFIYTDGDTNYVQGEKAKTHNNISNVSITIQYLNGNDSDITLNEFRLSIALKFNYTFDDIEEQNIIISFQYEEDITFLSMIESKNYKDINYNELYVYGNPMGHTFILFQSNDNIYIDKMIVDDVMAVNNPNDLKSSILIRMSANLNIQSIISISHSEFCYSQYALNIFYQQSNAIHLFVFNSSFHHIATAIRMFSYVESTIDINSCLFDKLGIYYAAIDTNDHQALSINYLTSIIIQNNIFSYYSTQIMYILGYSDMIMINNTFKIRNDNNSIWYKKGFIQHSDLDQLIVLRSSVNGNLVQIIKNQFNNSYMDLSVPMIRLNDGNGCISGNAFFNYAFFLNSGHLSSCVRPALYQTFVHSNYSDCFDIDYGIINTMMLNINDTFLITKQKNKPVFYLEHSILALSNVEFNLIHNTVNGNNNNSFIAINMSGDNKLILTESIWKGSVDIVYNDQCRVSCNQIFNQTIQNIISITQSSIICDDTENTNISNHVYNYLMMESNKTEYVRHLSPIYVELLGTMQYYAGNVLHFDYRIADKFGNTVQIHSFGTQISLSLTNDTLNVYEIININKENGCELCEMYISSILTANAGESYVIKVEEENDQFITKDMIIDIVDCPSGYGFNEFQCMECPNNYFSVHEASQCHLCDAKYHNNGINCIGGDEIIVDEHYWMDLREHNSVIISGACPFGYCCSISNGCDYLRKKSSLCSSNRDYHSVLCSKCIKGYSELYFSRSCGICNGNYYLWLLYPCFIGLVIVYYYLFLKADKLNKNRSNNYIKNNICSKISQCQSNNEYLVKLVKISVMNCILYYQQSVSQIISNSNINVNMATISAFFNLSIFESNDNSGNGYCFIDGMNAKQMILTEFIIIGMIMFILCLSYIIYRYIYQFKWILFNRNAVHSKTCVGLLLLCIGKILSVLFTLISCQTVGDMSVHFYFAYDECFDSVWWFALIGLCLIICFFIGIFFILSRMQPKYRQNEDNSLRPLTIPYKPQFYFWEFIIIARRILIAFLSISFGNNIYAKFTLIIILLIFLKLQYDFQPFVIHEINQIESNLLICIVTVVIIESFYNQLNNKAFVSVIISVLIIIPFIMLLLQIGNHIVNKQRKKMMNIYEYDRDSDMELMVTAQYTVSRPLLNDNIPIYESIESMSYNDDPKAQQIL